MKPRRWLKTRLHDKTPTVTDAADDRQRLEQALVDALSRHLDESKLRDVEDLGASLVARERLAQGRRDGVAVGLCFHVDEVDDDDAANVAQSKLASNLFGRFKVVAKDGLFKVVGANVLAGIDVDDGERFGAFNNQRSP